MSARKKNVSDYGEFALIEALTKNLVVSRRIVESVGDDSAVLKVPAGRDKYLLLTTDMMVEGVHFTRKMDARKIGRKALACNLSDIAAMGGRPLSAVISLGVPKRLSADFLRAVYSGIRTFARDWKVDIVGGDTVRSDKVVINIALLGEVSRKEMVTRGGARPGDRIFVTGPLGNSFRSGKHLSFEPRLDESRYLARHCRPGAMIDISDGLLSDLGHILKASRVGAEIHTEDIPKNPGATLEQALIGGEDYELLFTLAPAQVRRLSKRKPPFRFFCVGEITSGRRLRVLDTAGRTLRIKEQGFRHF